MNIDLEKFKILLEILEPSNQDKKTQKNGGN